jgi:glycosyltransferase involved in cell wall biosynthesis
MMMMNEHKRAQAAAYKYSAVIPVFNSGAIVGDTLDQTAAFFEAQGWDYEIVAVNDGSSDDSESVMCARARANPHIIAINLIRNFGQHNAVYCGLQHSSGDFVITLDDDLQNPPEEMIHLVDKALDDYDLVIGRFRTKQHAAHRRAGSRVIAWINRYVFDQPRDLVLTNFRLIRRDVVDRICGYNTSFPYITGLVLMFSSQPANVWVEHKARPVGQSNYNLIRIARLVTRILFSYSAFPLQLVSLIGIVFAVLAFVAGTGYLLKSLFFGARVPGWTTLVVLLSFFSGVNLILSSMLGQYVVRILQQSGSTHSYYVKNIVRADHD